MDFLLENNVKTITGPVGLFYFKGNNTDIFVFGDYHGDDYLSSDCQISNGCYHMLDIYQLFEDNNIEVDLYIELLKDKDIKLACSGQLKNFNDRNIKYKNLNVNRIDFRTPEFLDNFLQWIRTEVESGKSVDQIYNNYNSIISELILSNDKNTADTVDCKFLSKYNSDICTLFNLFQNKENLHTYYEYSEKKDIYDAINNIVMILDYKKDIENKHLYLYSSIITFQLVDIFTLILMELSQKKIKIYYGGVKHAENISNYLSSSGYKLIHQYELGYKNMDHLIL